MILTCPQCSTRYSAKPEAIGANGRTVRCSNCSNTWFVAADPDALALKDNEAEGIAARDFARQPAAVGAHVAMRDMTDQRRRNRRLFGVSMIWGVTLAILLIAAVLGYIFRQDIVDKNPKAATIYGAFGIEVTQSGLSFENAVTRSLFLDGDPVLIVNGAVRNVSPETTSVPMVQLTLHSDSGETLATWMVEADKPELAKGERAEFVSQYPKPPLDAVSLRYTFAGDVPVLSGPDTQEAPLPVRERTAVIQTPNR